MNERADSYIEDTKSFKYTDLVEDPNSIFYKRNRTDVYVAAAAIGFYNKKREKIVKKHGLFVSTTLGKNSESNIWILKSIGIATLGIDCLKDFKSIINVCDEYANSGIDFIYDVHTGSDDEVKEFASMMIDVLGELNLLQSN